MAKVGTCKLSFEGFGPDLQNIPIQAGEQLLVGRKGLADVRVPHPTVSVRAAVFRHHGESVTVEDLRSMSGTYVNGRRIGPGDPHVVYPGDRIRIGGVFCVVDGDVEGFIYLRIAELSDRRRLRSRRPWSVHRVYRGRSFPLGRAIVHNEADGARLEHPERGQALAGGDFFVAQGRVCFIHEEAPPTESALIAFWVEEVRSPSRDRRWTAAQMLGTLGPAHAAARVALDMALEDEDAVVRRWAQWAQGHAAARSIYLSLDARRHADLEWMELPLGARRMMSTSDRRADIVVPELGVETASHLVFTNVDGHCRIHDPSRAYGVVVKGVRIGEQPATAVAGERVLVGQAAFYVHEELPPAMHEDVDGWLAMLAEGPRDHRWLAARVLDRWVRGSEVVKAALSRATEDDHAPVRAWAERVLGCPDDALCLRVEAADDTPFTTRELTIYRHERYRIGGDGVWADITFGVPGMADRVAIVASDACGFWVEDLGSYDGVSLNGGPICGPTTIEPGDRIWIRSLRLSVLDQHEVLSAPESS